MISLRFVLISVFIAYTAAYPAPVRVGEDHTDIARDEPAWVYEYLPAMQRRELEDEIRNQLLARYLDNLDLDARAVGRTGSLSRVPSSAASSALKKTPTLPPNHAPNANIVPKIVVTPPKVAEPQAPPPATPPKAVEPQARPPPSSKPPAQAPIVNANNAPPNAASSTNPPPGGPAPEGPPAGVPKVDSAKPPPTDVEKSKTETGKLFKFYVIIGRA
ncbi:hypothetical protein ONZ45_g3124 [Pleurotus djamor]|nr:hypothetical protein ONZ45_g3124 [Pleurotus djamor]